MTGTAVARRDLKAELARFAPSLADLLPRGYTPERLITGALVATTRNPALLKCHPNSIAAALAQVAQWGLDVGTTAHLVPYGASCTPVADYKGYIELMCAAGARKVEAHEVREGDHFEYEYGSEPFLRHKPDGRSDAPITHAYGIVWLRGGVTQFEVMTVDEVEAIRKAKSQSWKNGELPGWYARKTVIRRLCKYVPKTPQLAALYTADDIEPALSAEEVTPEMLAALEPRRKTEPPAVASGDPYAPTEDDDREIDSLLAGEEA